MRRFVVIIFITFCSCIVGAKGGSFTACNQDGDVFHFFPVNDTTIGFDTDLHYSENEYIYKDTLRLPDTINCNGKKYIVDNSQCTKGPFIANATPIRPKVLIIPSNYLINPLNLWFPDKEEITIEGEKIATSTVLYYELDKEHSRYTSQDGIIYSKERDSLCIFPTGKRGTYYIPEFVHHINDLAFWATSIDSLIIPDNVYSFGASIILQAQRLKSFRYPNSLKSLEEGCAVWGYRLEEITFGSGLEFLGGDDFGHKGSPKLMRIVCLAITPPRTSVKNFYGGESLTLFVPRKSISQYKQAPGWSLFPNIAPIEPPVVSGVDNAEISWVTNAEASSYSLTLYLDAEHARRLLTLTFDDKGFLMNMDINPDAYSQPQSMQRHVRQLAEQQEGEDFNSYFSFTVTGLRAGSDYYFVRRTYNAFDEVIDEEQGSFATLPDTGTGMEQHPSLEVPAASNKLIRDGQLQIRCHDKTYTVQGVETK